MKWLSLYSTRAERASLKRRYAKDFISIPFVRDPFVKDKKAEEVLFELFR